MNAKAREVAVDEVLLRVQALAETQHSVVGIAQMFECGATRKWIMRRAAAGYMIKDGPSAYRMAGVRRTS
jgi:hypothetical protein